MSEFAVILPAAGSSSRYGGGRNKLFEDLSGQAVILRSLAAFTCRADVRQVVLAIPPKADWLAQAPPGLAEAMSSPKVRTCAGGACRAQSVRNALAAVDADVQWVAIHDAARPLVSQGLIDRTLAAAVEHGAAVPAMAVSLTIKQAAGPLPARVERTIPRQSLLAMQTPQIVRSSDLAEAFARCPLPLEQVTDDVQLIELIGKPVWLVDGEQSNLKITTAMDLKVAELILQEEVRGRRSAGATDY